MNNLVFKAYTIAEIAHRGQTRKYTGEPYINHPVEVMTLIMSYADVYEDDTLSGAILHDVYEDCGVPLDVIACEINQTVADIVEGCSKVSKLEDGNRKVRTALDHAHYSSYGETLKVKRAVQNIKVADLTANCKNVVAEDREFAKRYLVEKQELLDMLPYADPYLHELAQEVLDEQKKLLES